MNDKVAEAREKAKAEASEKEKVEAAKRAAEEKAAKEAELKAAAEAEADRIANMSEEEITSEKGEDEDAGSVGQPTEAQIRGSEAANHLRRIALTYPASTPNEHTIFGFGGLTFNLGQLRDLFGLPRA